MKTPFWQMIGYLSTVSAVGTFLLCYLMRHLSPRIGYVDRPAGRKNHTRVMPYGGGIAIFITFASLILAGTVLVYFNQLREVHPFDWTTVHQAGVANRLNEIGGILLGGLILLILGLFDDLKDLGPRFKLIVQFAVATLVVIGFDVRLYLFSPGAPFGWILTILWIVTLTNAFNFLDNADGLSAGVALVCTMVLLAVAVAGGQVLVSAFLACLAGALVGFLFHNFPPAKIFLGDAGSLVIGYLPSGGSILPNSNKQAAPQPRNTAVLIPLIVMAIPLYDLLSVIVLRLRRGISPFVGDHRHFSHRLMKRGLSTRQMVFTIYLASAGTAVGAILLRYVGGLPAILIFLQTLCIVAIIGILEYQPIKNENHS